jgi:hypothetical protein
VCLCVYVCVCVCVCVHVLYALSHCLPGQREDLTGKRAPDQPLVAIASEAPLRSTLIKPPPPP